MTKHLSQFFILLISFLVTTQVGSPLIARNSAERVGMSPVGLSRIDEIVKAGIRGKAFPGCQVVVLKDGQPVYDKCFGNYTYEGAHEVKPTTLYDLASLSKTTGTLLAVMKLVDSGKLKLTDKASAYLPFLRGTDKENITITELLIHESGLPASLPFYRLVLESTTTHSSPAAPKHGTPHNRKKNRTRIIHPAYQFKEGWVSTLPSFDYPYQVADSFYVHRRIHGAAMQMIADAHLYDKVYCYSDVNFIVIKEIVETISRMAMDVFLEKEFFAPLKLRTMCYLPLRTHKRDDVAPTLKNVLLRHGKVQGYVHDPDAAFLGGVSGNAGLFASARDVAAVYQMLLNGGEMDGHRYLSEETCRLFTTTTSPSGRRGLGFDKPVPARPKINPCCASAPVEVYGHTGYTGTCCWVDPLNKVVYVFLSNRTYPEDGKNKLLKMSIRPKIQEAIYQSMKSGEGSSSHALQQE
jgi:CubicO group peptidase (beta-lactamase class C family)